MFAILKLLLPVIPWFSNTVGRIPLVRALVSSVIINNLASAAPPRPRPFSMVGDYTSWVSLTDRSYTERHLPPADPAETEELPSESSLTELYRRTREVKSTDTSVMFMFFAQWFTDSFLRTNRRNRRKNTSTQEIDFCQIYGLTEAKTHMLRSHSGGHLRSQFIDADEYPEFLFEPCVPGGRPVFKPHFKGLHDELFITDVILADVPDDRRSAFFAVGLEHGNSTIGSTVLDTVFLREHNRIADIIRTESPDWDDERLFQTTRNIMIRLLLKLVVEQYVRHIIPFDFPMKLVPFIAERARWNRSNRIAIEFNLLYRWHAMVPDSIDTDLGALGPGDFRNNNPLVISAGVESLIAAFSKQRAGKVGLFNTPGFLVDRSNPELPSVEERTISLMRFARLRPYNEYRRQFGLKPLASFGELTDDTVVRERLEALYGHIDRLEWYVGIFAEGYPGNAVMGELMTVMVGHDAFTQALTNPLLSRNVHNEATFSRAGLDIIEQTASLEQIVARNSRDGASVHASFEC